jgi:hypothetical protein
MNWQERHTNRSGSLDLTDCWQRAPPHFGQNE